jgi:hypothetical protein
VSASNDLKVDVEACDEFYKTLQSTIDKPNKGDVILIMGDFKSKKVSSKLRKLLIWSSPTHQHFAK